MGEKIKKAINWLYCQENENDGILIQTEASDWADLMPRDGKVLYANTLWYKIKKDYNLLTTQKTKKDFNLLFYPYNNKTKNLPKSDKATIEMILKKKSMGDFYLSFVGYLYWGKDIDVYGNFLALLFGLPTDPAGTRNNDRLNFAVDLLSLNNFSRGTEIFDAAIRA